MDLLGIEVDRDSLCGSWDRSALLELHDAVQFALTSIMQMPDLDAGCATVVDHGSFRCTLIECGLRAGYYHDALTRLLKLVNEALTAAVHFITHNGASWRRVDRCRHHCSLLPPPLSGRA
jgi:hypothetical protein